MPSPGRHRARLKPPDEERLHGGLKPGHAIPYYANLQAMLDLSQEINQRIERDDGKPDVLLRAVELSRWIWAEAQSLPAITALPTMAASVEAYKSVLQTVLTDLERDTMNEHDEKMLNAQVDLFLGEFKKKFSMARSTGSDVKPAAGGSSFFQNASNFIINGGNFISHTDTPHADLQEIYGEIIQSVSGGNPAVLRDIARLQETSEQTLRAMRFNTIVLFY